MNGTSPAADLVLDTPSSINSLPKSNTQDLPRTSIFHWTAAGGVQKILGSARFLARFGVPSCLQLSPSYMLVGLSLGAVACFNYHQKLVHVFDHREPSGPETDPRTAVLCIGVSSDGRLAAAGCVDGRTFIWEFPGPGLSSPQTVPPHHVLHPPSRGLPIPLIQSVAFVGNSHDIVTSDLARTVIFHHVFSKFFQVHYTSEQVHQSGDTIRGGDKTRDGLKIRPGSGSTANLDNTGQNLHRYSTAQDVFQGPSRTLGQTLVQNPRLRSPSTHLGSGQDKNQILDCLLLPVGTSTQITDQIGLVGVITYNSLTVLSIRSLNNSGSTFPKVHIRVARPKDAVVTASSPGLLAWYPCIQGTTTAKLAYSWANVVSMLEVDFSGLPANYMQILSGLKDKDRGVPVLPHRNIARFWFPETLAIQAIKWLNSEILCVVVHDTNQGCEELCFFHCPNLTLVARDRFPFQELASSLPGHAQNQLQIFRHRPVVLAAHSAIYTGKVLKWADHLVSLLTEKLFAEAFERAYYYYSSEETGRQLLYGLPHTLRERQLVVEPFLVNIMREAAVGLAPDAFLHDHGLSPGGSPEIVGIGGFLRVVSEITANRGGVLDADLLEVIELVYEKASDKAAFFETLSDYIVSRKITNLSPGIFKLLVQYSVENGHGERLTDIICLLDVSTLNIDMTLKLCRSHGLWECSAYIWNSVFHDYLTPLWELQTDVGQPNHNDHDPNLVYSYMAYILSGRRFPTDEFLDPELEVLGREIICGLLFSTQANERGPPVELEESPFPYLFFFLKKNSFEMLATLNEFLENPVLNTEAAKTLSRQYIVDAVLDTFHVHRDSLGATDFVQLAVFVGRNYPKYNQFIRISDTVVHEAVGWLLRGSGPSSDHHLDRELALECLLPFHFAADEGYFLEQMKQAKFFHAAFRVYVQTHRYSLALDMWMQWQGQAGPLEVEFSAVGELLRNAFGKGLAAEQARVLSILGLHCRYFFGHFSQLMAELGHKHCAKIHLLALDCDPVDAYRYLQGLCEEDLQAKPLAHAYIRLACSYEPGRVSELVDKHKATLGADHELMGELHKNKQHEAVALVFAQDGQYEQALGELVAGIAEDGARNGETTGPENDRRNETAVDRMVTQAIAICVRHPQHWRYLMKTLGTCTPNVDQAMYRCFRAMIDSDGPAKGRFNDVLAQMMEQAQVSNVRATLQDILTSFYFESEINVICLAKISDQIRKALDTHRVHVLRGWLVLSTSCASCAKAVWGADMPSTYLDDNEMALQERAGSRARGELPDLSAYLQCQLMFFRCGHIYHERCLRGLGERKCVLCTA